MVGVVGVVSKNLAGWYEKLMITSWKKTKVKLDQLRFAAGKKVIGWCYLASGGSSLKHLTHKRLFLDVLNML